MDALSDGTCRVSHVDGKLLALRVVHSCVAINPQLVSLVEIRARAGRLLPAVPMRLLLTCHAGAGGEQARGPLQGDAAVGVQHADQS